MITKNKITFASICEKRPDIQSLFNESKHELEATVNWTMNLSSLFKRKYFTDFS